MAVLASRVTVGTTATRLDSAVDTEYDQTTVIVRCPTAAMTIGGPGVTTATGFTLAANEWLEWALTGYDALYGVVAVAAECQVIQRNSELTT